MTTTLPTRMPTAGMPAVRALTGRDGQAARDIAATTVTRFLDVAVAATGRATFYNTLAEQQDLEARAHWAMATLDRRLYAGLIASPGATDRTRRTGVLQLLRTPVEHAGDADSDAVARAVRQLSVPRMLNLYGDLATERINNARARKLVLRTLLGSPALEKWSVRYRRKVAAALRHAWGGRLSGILRSVLTTHLAGGELSDKERRLLAREIDAWAGSRAAAVRECVAFVLQAPGPWTLPLLRAYVEVRTDLDAGAVLPYETVEGMRGRYHGDVPPGRVLELTKSQLTDGQRLARQEHARREGVDVAVDFSRYDAVRLYLYAFATGMTDDVGAALDRQARRTAATLGLGDRRVTLVLDGSASGAGDATQRLRPIAVTLALRDALRAAAGETRELWCAGSADGRLVRPQGHTALASRLVEALQDEPDLVVVVSDGYENASAGRFAQTLAAARELGCRVPVVQIAPVLAAEAEGVRALAEGLPAMPVQRPEALELALCRLLLEAEPAAAVPALLALAGLAELENDHVTREEVTV